MITKEHITVGLRKNGDLLRPAINKDAEIHLFGQEVNPETWAVSKSDLFMKDPTGRDADNIAYGSTLSNDRHAGQAFDYLIANPPYGKDWKRDEDAVRAEHERGAAGRFAPGLPRISDGQLLFLLHMLAHAKEPKEGGSRIAIIMNGSPLFTGDAGSGESEIRRFILENDLLEALIALPEQLFYNTGIATYVWVVTNRKAPARKGKVQLIDARPSFWVPMRKSLGDKRREIPLERAQDILRILSDFKDGETRKVTKDGKEEDVVVSRIFPTTHFGFRKITVERPLRLNFQASAGAHRPPRGGEGLPGAGAVEEEGRRGREGAGRRARAAGGHPEARARAARHARQGSRRVRAAARRRREEGRREAPGPRQEGHPLRALRARRDGRHLPRQGRQPRARPGAARHGERAARRARRGVLRARGDSRTSPTPGSTPSKRDPKDGQVGLVGYEINFNRYFYRYTPPRPLEEIEADIRAIEQDILRMLAEVTGGPSCQVSVGTCACKPANPSNKCRHLHVDADI